MAASDTARLIATLELQDKGFTKNIDRMTGSLGKLGAKSTAIGTAVGVGIERLAEKGIGFLFGQIREGNATLVELQEITAATGAVIESTGGKAGVSAEQVRTLSESLEDLTTADDKVIQSGQNMLLTFTNIGAETFPRATKAMVDMAIAMNNGSTEGLDLESTAIQIGKALNDPIKGVTALRKVGVALTKQQEDQIKAFVESGDIMGAQAVILKELETEFGKAGEAAGKSGASGLRRFQDAIEDSQLALAQGLAPALEDIRGEITKALANPQTQQDIRNFGTALGDAATKAIAFVKTVPWGEIGSGLRTAADWAGRLFNAFMSLPTEVKGILIGLTALNKLSGGAVLKIGVDFAKGAFDQFLSRGATPVNPLFVMPVGGGIGGPGGGGAVVPTGGTKGSFIKGGLLGLLVGLVGGVEERTPDQGPNWFDRMFGGGKPLPVAVVSGLKPRTGGESPDERDEKAVADFKAAVEQFGTHTDAVKNFGSTELTAFRTTAEGAIDLFDERIKYLAGAQGSGAGTEAYLALVQRDIDALKTIIPTASAEDAAAITAQIAVLQGILDAKKFAPTQELLDAIKNPNPPGLSPDAKDAANRQIDASRATAEAIKNKAWTPKITVNTSVNVSTSVTVRDQQRKTRSAVSTGTSYGIS